MRKKTIGDLASNKIIGGSHAKKQPSRCKVASFGVQGNTHYGAKLQLLGCDSNFFGFNLAYLPTTNAPLPIKSLSSQNCIFMQPECIFMQFWVFLSDLIVKMRA